MENEFIFMEKMMAGWANLRRIPLLQYQHNSRELVFEYEKIRLFHYAAKSDTPSAVPVLVVFATVNRPEIIDLFPDQSLIGGLLENGMDVYLLDWGYPDSTDQQVSMTDYVTRFLHGCVEFIRASTKVPAINLLGICQGGLICLSYASLYKTIKNLVLISVPIDFSTEDNVIAKIFKQLTADKLINPMTGNVSGLGLTQFFISLRPFELIGKKYLRFVDHIEDALLTDKFLQVEKWLYDAPDQPGKAFSELITQFYQENGLINGKILIDNKPVLLNQLTMPVLNIMGEEDEIVPMSASICLKDYIGTHDYTERSFASGHIGIYISTKVGKRLAKTIAEWFIERSKVSVSNTTD